MGNRNEHCNVNVFSSPRLLIPFFVGKSVSQPAFYVYDVCLMICALKIRMCMDIDTIHIKYTLLGYCWLTHDLIFLYQIVSNFYYLPEVVYGITLFI